MVANDMPDWLMTYLASLQSGVMRGLATELRSGGLGTLVLAYALGARSIAFPSISTGIYGFPQPLASQTAVASMRSLEPISVQRCVLVAYDPGTLAALDEALSTPSATPPA